MGRLLAGAVALALVVTVAAADDKKEKDKKDKPTVYKVTADEIAKEFKDDHKAAKKKYEGAEIQLTGTATLPIGSGKDVELIVENESKIPIRMATGGKRPANFPAKFTATATYKGYFEMAKELSLTASAVEFKK